MSYSAVTRMVQRFEQKIKKDKELKKRIESIKADLSNVKGPYRHGLPKSRGFLGAD